MKLTVPAARHQRIFSLLRAQGEVRISELCKQFNVTPMTAWRDLKTLEELGLLRRVHGGAVDSGKLSHEFAFETKANAGAESKELIAQLAVKEFVREGDTLAVEGGTTAAALVEALPQERVSIVTNSLPVALRARHCRPGLPVRVIGGCLSTLSGNAVGSEALRQVRQLKISSCFLSAVGWDNTRGPMDPNPLEIEIKRAIAAHSERVILLMDHRKFSISSSSIMIHPRRIHALVTDRSPPRAVIKLLEGNGARIIFP